MKRRSRARRWRRRLPRFWFVHLDPEHWVSISDYLRGAPLELDPGEADVAPLFCGEIGVFRGVRFHPSPKGE